MRPAEEDAPNMAAAPPVVDLVREVLARLEATRPVIIVHADDRERVEAAVAEAVRVASARLAPVVRVSSLCAPGRSYVTTNGPTLDALPLPRVTA